MTRRSRHLAFATAALAMVVPTIGVAASASAAPAPTMPTRAAKVISQKADIDGDKRADTVTVTQLSERDYKFTFRLSVRTAAGRTASTLFTVNDNSYEGLRGPTDVFEGTSPMDGTRGDEIIIDLSGGAGEASFLRSFTWRNNKLVTLAAPGTTKYPEWTYSWFPQAQLGYTFSTVKGKRHVVMHLVQGSTVTHTRYVSKGTGWAKLSATRGNVTQKQANALAGWRGLKITKKV